MALKKPGELGIFSSRFVLTKAAPVHVFSAELCGT